MIIYEVELIGAEEKDRLFERYEDRFLYTGKSEIYGCCIKILTDDERVMNRWEDNFYTMSENIRSHGRLVVLDEEAEGNKVKYDPLTKTAFLYNFEYYGWIKSITLAVAGDVLEDEHRIYSVHGAAIGVGGRGISLIAPSKTGKTTHSWGLLRLPDARLVTDDWYFVRLSSKRPLIFGSEKNNYVEADIGEIWDEYQGLMRRADFDRNGRAIVNVRWIVGQGGVIPMTTLYHIVLMKRDKSDDRVVRRMDVDEAMDYLIEHDFCNPHQLVTDDRKRRLRERFFRRMLEKTDLHMLNTIRSPEETQAALRSALGID